MTKKELEVLVDSLNIQIKHLENDYHLTKEEHEETTSQYLNILSDLSRKNEELTFLKNNLQIEVEKRTKELYESQEYSKLKSSELQLMLDNSSTLR